MEIRILDGDGAQMWVWRSHSGSGSMGSGAELPLQSWEGSIVILEGVASVLIDNEWGDKPSEAMLSSR